MKTILLHVYEDHAMEARLQVALDLARAHDAHVEAVQTHGFAVSADMGMTGAFDAAVITMEMREQEDVYRKHLESRLGGEDVRWNWHDINGEPTQILADNSNFADIILVGQPGRAKDGVAALSIAGDLLFSTQTPLMLVPAESKAFDSTAPVIAAWDGSSAAAHAIRAALPFFRTASSVHLVTVGDRDQIFSCVDAASWLSRHGIHAESHVLRWDDYSIAEHLGHFAARMNASAIVMGAYGHSRLRETLFGGVTRELMKSSRLPLIMAH